MSEKTCLLWLRIVYLFFFVQGLSWALLGSFDPFGLWDSMAARSLFPEFTATGSATASLPPDAETFKRFVLGLLGATNSAFWLVCLLLLEIPVRRRERWAYWGLVGGLLCWFLVDTPVSLAHGAVFNVLVVNLPCLFLAGTPLLFLGLSRRSHVEP